MQTVQARNINDAYFRGLLLLGAKGIPDGSRNGDVLKVRVPVTTLYERPTERVLFDAKRDANPFFHFFEALHLLAGRRDVKFLAQFNSKIGQYSDDGVVFHAAYGHRLREYFGFDQLLRIQALLQRDPYSRRAIAQIWDAKADLLVDGTSHKDLPCNDTLKFSYDPLSNALNLQVFNRSNDIIWGAYGSNVVQFSTLLEYMAKALDMQVGWYAQISGDFHAYMGIWNGLEHPSQGYCPYERDLVHPFPLFELSSQRGDFDDECRAFVDHPTGDSYDLPFFYGVAQPLYLAWAAYKREDWGGVEHNLLRCAATDWRLACTEWMARRKQKRMVAVLDPNEEGEETL